MFANVWDGKKLTRRLKTYLGVETHGLFSGITPKKRALVLLDDRKSGAKERAGESLSLVVRKGRHSAESILILIREAFVSFEIKRGDTHELFVDKSSQVKSEFIVITLKNTILYGSVRTQHFVSDRVCINGLDS